MNLNIKTISKIVRSCMLVGITCFTLGLQADNALQDLKLFSDSSFNSIFFAAQPVDNKFQIIEKIKPSGSSTWGAAFVISDSDIQVNAYNVKKDSDDNIVVAWTGIDYTVGSYNLYIRYYISANDTWSSITQVNSSSEYLTGNFALSIDTQKVEIVYTYYNSTDFSLTNGSASYPILQP